MVAYGKLGNIHNGHKVNPTNEFYIIYLISSSVDVQFIVIVIQRWTPAAPVQGAHGELLWIVYVIVINSTSLVMYSTAMTFLMFTGTGADRMTG